MHRDPLDRLVAELPRQRFQVTALGRAASETYQSAIHSAQQSSSPRTALDQAKQTLELVPEAKRQDAAVKAVQTMIDLAEQADALGPIAELEQKVAADPKDYQARFDLATALNAAGKREDATTHLLDVVKRDRKWNDDGARKQLVQFFEAWGSTDDATVAGRKRLSSVLFA